MTTEEVAELLEISPASVSRIQKRALEKFDAFKDDPDFARAFVELIHENLVKELGSEVLDILS
jgi:predicted transcriptional regulator